jgi:hypothetical protein
MDLEMGEGNIFKNIHKEYLISWEIVSLCAIHAPH